VPARCSWTYFKFGSDLKAGARVCLYLRISRRIRKVNFKHWPEFFQMYNGDLKQREHFVQNKNSCQVVQLILFEIVTRQVEW